MPMAVRGKTPDGGEIHHEGSFLRQLKNEVLKMAEITTGDTTMASDNIVFRLERKQDRDTVERITYRAFINAPPTGVDDDGAEPLLARMLRTDPAFVPKLNYIAEVSGRVVGNIMYTKSKVVTHSGAEIETLTFGPVSVLPAYQRQGIGSKLILHTLEIARGMGYPAVLIFGYESYYPRFGFKPASEYGITTSDGSNFPAFMALPLHDGALDGVRGRFFHADVFNNLDLDESDALNKKLAEPMDIDEYISVQNPEIQPILHKVRNAIRTAAPDAVEKISWQMPTFWQGENLIHFCAQKKHLGIHPGYVDRLPFKDRLAAYKTSKGAVQFPYDKPVDYELIVDITRWRVTDVEGT